MIQSMTGYGKAQGAVGSKKLTVEIKSVNSKGLDLSTKVPSLYRGKEIDIRKLISSRVQRGKVECYVQYEMLETTKAEQLNTNLVKAYLKELETLETSTGVVSPDKLALVMRMPDVFKPQREDLPEEEWIQLQSLLNQAMDSFTEFRTTEGGILEKDFALRVNNIQTLLDAVSPFEEARVKTLRDRLEGGLQELSEKMDADNSRLEQEMIFYIEKLDITEEKVRLAGHCKYFLETMNGVESQGKKLGFIGQEMGREINTLGSKANHAEIQKLVVQMKDELEKIKEQVLNVI